jgi:hypothetical protein
MTKIRPDKKAQNRPFQDQTYMAIVGGPALAAAFPEPTFHEMTAKGLNATAKSLSDAALALLKGNQYITQSRISDLLQAKVPNI